MTEHIVSVYQASPNVEKNVIVAGWRAILGGREQTLVVDAPDDVRWRLQLAFQPDIGVDAAAFSWVPVSDWQIGSSSKTLATNFPGVYSLHIDVAHQGDEVCGHWLGQCRVLDRSVISTLGLAAAQRLVAYDHGWQFPQNIDLKRMRSLDALADRLLAELVGLEAGFWTDFLCPSPQLRLATFAALRIGGLYDFGLEDPSCAACVLTRAVEDWPRNCGEFLAASTGCCLDLAAVLASVLDRFGIKNRAVSILDEHVFNEVQIDGYWYALDPSIQAVYDRDYQNIIKNGGKIHLWPLTPGGPGRPVMRHSQRALRNYLLSAPELLAPCEIRLHVPKVVFEKQYEILNRNEPERN